jgi:hypothetical protein
MPNTYKLVNPYIKGEFETKLEAKNSIEAARVFYKNLSENFNNSVPRFYFTIQKGGKGKFYHFEVKEKKSEDAVDYNIKPFEIKGEDAALEQYLNNFEHFKGRYNGGAKRRGSRRSSRRSSRKSSDLANFDSDSDDYYREAKSYVPVTTQPFYYMYYDPLLYKMDTVYFPTLYPTVSSFVLLNTNYTYPLVPIKLD